MERDQYEPRKQWSSNVNKNNQWMKFKVHAAILSKQTHTQNFVIEGNNIKLLERTWH